MSFFSFIWQYNDKTLSFVNFTHSLEHCSYFFFKVQLFWEGHKNFHNLPHGFDIDLVNVKTIRKIGKIFVAFSENLNFNYMNSPDIYCQNFVIFVENEWNCKTVHFHSLSTNRKIMKKEIVGTTKHTINSIFLNNSYE